MIIFHSHSTVYYFVQQYNIMFVPQSTVYVRYQQSATVQNDYERRKAILLGCAPIDIFFYYSVRQVAHAATGHFLCRPSRSLRVFSLWGTRTHFVLFFFFSGIVAVVVHTCELVARTFVLSHDELHTCCVCVCVCITIPPSVSTATTAVACPPCLQKFPPYNRRRRRRRRRSHVLLRSRVDTRHEIFRRFV